MAGTGSTSAKAAHGKFCVGKEISGGRLAYMEFLWLPRKRGKAKAGSVVKAAYLVLFGLTSLDGAALKNAGQSSTTIPILRFVFEVAKLKTSNTIDVDADGRWRGLKSAHY